jgi:hypothetical protein
VNGGVPERSIDPVTNFSLFLHVYFCYILVSHAVGMYFILTVQNLSFKVHVLPYHDTVSNFGILQVFSNLSYTDEYTGITATSTVHSYYPHEWYHQTPEKQTEKHITNFFSEINCNCNYHPIPPKNIIYL